MLDDSGNIYVAGGSYNQANTDMIVLKYDQNQNLVWADTMDLGNNDAAKDIALNQNGDILVTGTSYIADRDILSVKFQKQQTDVGESVISPNISHLKGCSVRRGELKIQYNVGHLSEFYLVNSAGRVVSSRSVVHAGLLTFKDLETGI